MSKTAAASLHVSVAPSRCSLAPSFSSGAFFLLGSGKLVRRIGSLRSGMIGPVSTLFPAIYLLSKKK